jgi:glucose-1-phosphate cytidylyltransferase
MLKADFEAIPVVILCGGTGTRLHEETEFIPKPLVKIGDTPILVHIMNHYAAYGFRHFILCLGYKGFQIKEYFLNWAEHVCDFTLDLWKDRDGIEYHNWLPKHWKITFAETGRLTQTGGRIKRIESYVSTPHFVATSGDGLSDVRLDKLYEQHVASGMIATMTGVRMPTRFGVVEDDGYTLVRGFREKEELQEKINGGFFVFSKEIFRYIDGDTTVLEQEPFHRLVEEGKMGVYQHNGFWQCMDTYKELIQLNRMVDEGNMPWILQS